MLPVTLIKLAKPITTINNIHRLLKIFLQAYGIYKKLNNHQGIAQSYGFIGQSYEKTNAYGNALKYQQLALTEFKKG
jgi:hypothetical protein